MEDQQSLKFELSYLMDVICFMDVLLELMPFSNKETLTHFQDYLGYGSEAYLKKVKKILPKTESFRTLFLPVIVADPAFSQLSPAEFLGNPKTLFQHYRQSPYCKQASARNNRFLAKHGDYMAEGAVQLIRDLERGGFKTFWLKEQLPLLKEIIGLFDEKAADLNLEGRLRDFLQTAPVRKEVFVLAFPSHGLASLHNGQFLVSRSYSPERLVQSLVEDMVYAHDFKSALKKEKGRLKKWESLKQSHKAAPKGIGSLMDYLDQSLKAAISCHLGVQLGLVLEPGTYFQEGLKERYTLASQLWGHLDLMPPGCHVQDCLEGLLAHFADGAPVIG